MNLCFSSVCVCMHWTTEQNGVPTAGGSPQSTKATVREGAGQPHVISAKGAQANRNAVFQTCITHDGCN